MGEAFQKRPRKWPWRDFLTAEEAEELRLADEAKATWERLNATRPRIMNRAIQRAKAAVHSKGAPTP